MKKAFLWVVIVLLLPPILVNTSPIVGTPKTQRQKGVEAINSIPEWNQTYREKYDDESAYSLAATSDGGYALAGTTSSCGAGDADA